MPNNARKDRIAVARTIGTGSSSMVIVYYRADIRGHRWRRFEGEGEGERGRGIYFIEVFNRETLHPGDENILTPPPFSPNR